MSNSLSLNILMAAPYLDSKSIDLIKHRESDVSFLLDSGAFTAWRAGKECDVGRYADFVESLPFKPWRYFTLDVIGNPTATAKNLEYLIARGLKPVPIFTRGEDICRLDDLYELSDLVAVGGLVGTRGNQGFVNGFMKAVKGRKVHWLGYGRIEFVKRWRPFSFDSASWGAGVMYGCLRLYRGFGRFTVLSKKDLVGEPTREVGQAFADMGFDHAMMRSASRWQNTSGFSPLLFISLRSWVRFSLDLQRQFGIKMFLACPDANTIATAIREFDYCRKNWYREELRKGGQTSHV